MIKLSTLGGPGHTATCIQDCRYAWVAGYGSIYVLNLDEPDQLPGPQMQQTASQVEVGDLWTDAEGNPTIREFEWSTHDVQVDAAGYAWVVGGDGTVAFDVRPGSYPAPGKPYPQSLLEPRLVARTGPAALNDGDPFDDPTAPDPDNSQDAVNDFIHHNSWRPDATEFSSRSTDRLNDPGVRPGELVLITEEDIWSRATASTTPGGCETQGSFQTWQVKQLGDPGPDDGTVAHLDSWTTEFNELLQGDDDQYGRDLVPTKGFCSSHYFPERDGLVAVAWYEQGTRLLDVSDPSDIRQVAYFLPPGGTTWAAYWSPTDPEIVYAVDNNRGVDVLRVDREAVGGGGGAVRAPLAPWWLGGGGADAVRHPKFGFVCRLPL